MKDYCKTAKTVPGQSCFSTFLASLYDLLSSMIVVMLAMCLCACQCHHCTCGEDIVLVTCAVCAVGDAAMCHIPKLHGMLALRTMKTLTHLMFSYVGMKKTPSLHKAGAHKLVQHICAKIMGNDTVS